MPDSIERLHSDINFIISQDNARYFSPEEIDAGVNLAILDLYNQQYKIYEESQRITDQLSRFKVAATLPVSGGFVVKPDDYVYWLNMIATKISITSVLKKITVIQEQFLGNHIGSDAFAPDDDNIIARHFANGLQIYPTSVTEISLAYLRRPLEVKFNYTIAGINLTAIVYNPVGSIQIDYSPVAYNQILQKTVRYLGITTKDSTLIQSEQIAKAGDAPENR